MSSEEKRLTLEELVTVTEEVEPYVLTLEDTETDVDGSKEAKVLVVLKRPGGVLLAVPAGFIAEDLLEQGNGGSDSMVGPSLNITVPGVVLDNGVVSLTGTTVNAVLVDCTAQILDFLRLPSLFEEIADMDDPFALPAGDAAITAALEWIPQVAGLADFYTAESSAPRTPLQRARERKPGGDKGTPTGPKGAKQKKPTTASLAESMEVLMQTIPGLTTQLQELSERQNWMEQRLAQPSSGHRGTLSQPLGASFEGRLASVSALAATAKAPPKTAERQQLGIPGFQAERGQGACRGEATAWGYAGTCSSGTVTSPDNPHWSDLTIIIGSHGRFRIGRWCGDQGVCWPSSSSTRAVGPEGGLFRRCGSEHGEKDVTYLDDRLGCYVVALVVEDSNRTYKFAIYGYKLGIFNLKLPISSCQQWCCLQSYKPNRKSDLRAVGLSRLICANSGLISADSRHITRVTKSNKYAKRLANPAVIQVPHLWKSTIKPF